MLTPKILRNFYTRIEEAARDKEIIAGKSGRHMKFPYTASAKIAQFPYFYYLKNNVIWMYLPAAFMMGLYVFIKINGVVNSKENIENWAETQRKNAEKDHSH